MTRSVLAAGLVLGAISTLDCAGVPSPTSPTSTATPTSDLHWNVTAPGCAPALPLPVLSEWPDTRTANADGGVTARWLVFAEKGGELRRYVVGDFRPVAAGFGICAWSTLERAVDR